MAVIPKPTTGHDPETVNCSHMPKVYLSP